MKGQTSYNKPNSRGQTQLDFIIGVGIFFVAIGLVFAGAAAVLQPFTSGQENIAAGDRVADKLTNSHLTTDERQYVLDKDCTVVFFESLRNGPETPPSDCRFDEMNNNAELTTIFGIDATYYVNITIENESGVVSMDGTTLAAGTLPDTGAITVTQRVVRIGDETYYAYVRLTR